MKRSFVNPVTILLAMLFAGAASIAQRAPASPSQPWQGTPIATPPRSIPAFAPDPNKTYNLPELINIAEQNNPDTRVAWETAKAQIGRAHV